MNNNLRHVNEQSLSDRDIIQEKDNSIQNKSFYSTDLDFPNLIYQKDYFKINIINDEYSMDLNSKSIAKIFSLISGNEREKLEEDYLDYITWLIGVGNEIEKQELLTPNGKPDANETNLQPAYHQLLTQTKIYYINIPKLNKFNQINKRIKLKNISLEKIFYFLGLDIFDMSDYIEIFILSFQDKELLENKKSIRSKLLYKFNYECNKEISNEFNIYKKMDLVIKESKKCKKTKLQNLDDCFDKVWNEIEKKNNNERSDDTSEEDFSSEKNEDESNKGNNYDVPNSYNINKNFNKNNDKNQNIESSEENACGENICANICNIF